LAVAIGVLGFALCTASAFSSGPESIDRFRFTESVQTPARQYLFPEPATIVLAALSIPVFLAERIRRRKDDPPSIERFSS